jgi:glutamine cyclotransferase
MNSKLLVIFTRPIEQMLGRGEITGRGGIRGKISFLIICAFLSMACNNNRNAKQNGTGLSTTEDNIPNLIKYRVVDSFPHDTNAFTEGLLVHEGLMFESTGHTDLYPSTRSLFGVVDLSSGKIQTKAEIDKNKYFGEGIAFFKEKIYQLTLVNKIGFIYNAKTYKKMGEFHYNGEGWGMTTDGSYLIMSDGSSNISYCDPLTFKPVKILGVEDNNGLVSNINELELINCFIYDNQWLTGYILKIDTSSGKVVGKLDLSSLKSTAVSKYPGSAEMNGIAYDAVTNKIYITGKLWPNIYEIKFSH